MRLTIAACAAVGVLLGLAGPATAQHQPLPIASGTGDCAGLSVLPYGSGTIMVRNDDTARSARFSVVLRFQADDDRTTSDAHFYLRPRQGRFHSIASFESSGWSLTDVTFFDCQWT